jgi:Methylamine utilisation protein MauE
MLTLSVAFFAALLYAAAIGKAFRAKSWVEVSSRLVPGPLGSRVFAAAVPIAEVVAASLLLLAPMLGSPLVALLMVGFAGGTCVLSKRLSGLRCECFGGLSRSSFGPSLCRRNAALAVLACFLAAAAPRRSVVDWSAADWRWLSISLAGVGSVLVVRHRVAERIPRDLSGRVWLGVFVTARCSACVRIFEAVADEAQRAGPPVVVIPLGRGEEFPRQLQPLLRHDLAHLARSWNVRGTPFAALVSAGGRILASGAATNASELSHIRSADSSVTARRISRREALGLGIRAYAGALLALQTFVLTLSASSGSARANRDVRITRRKLNRIEASCSQFKHRACKEGVVISDSPVKFDHSLGCEFGATVGPDNVDVVVCKYEYFDAGFFWSGYCPCDANKTVYESRTECKTDCPSHGLECFGQQCQTTRDEYCAKLRFTICVRVSGWTVNTLEWAPSRAQCASNADRVNMKILAHELGHVSDDRDVAQKIKQDFKLEKCGRTQRDVLAQLAAEMEQIRAAKENAFKTTFTSESLLRRARRDERNTEVTCGAGGC